jgi:hypothetical protein
VKDLIKFWSPELGFEELKIKENGREDFFLTTIYR